MAPSGNLFLLLTLPEMRRQGLTYLAFYALQRTVDVGEFSEYWLRRETGLEDYEVRGSPRSVGRVESGLLGFPYSVISMACVGDAFHKVTIIAKTCLGNRNHLSEMATFRQSGKNATGN